MHLKFALKIPKARKINFFGPLVKMSILLFTKLR